MRRLYALSGLATIFAVLQPAQAGAPKCVTGECDPACGNLVEYEIVELAGLEGLSIQPEKINDLSQVAGTLFPDSLFVWDAGEVQTLSFPGLQVCGDSISENGTVLGSIRDAAEDTVDAVIWFPALGTHEILDAQVNVWPNDLNDDLLIVGLGNDELEGFVLDGNTGVYTPLLFGDPPAQPIGTAGALAVNNNGMVVGSEVVFDTHPQFPNDPPFFFEKPFVWTEDAGLQALLLDASTIQARAVDINTAGDVAGYRFNEFFEMRPAWWPQGASALLDLGVPSGFFVAEATAINDHGQILVLAPNDLFGFTRGYLWDNGAYKNLSARIPCDPPLEVHVAADINNAGEILARVRPSGKPPGPFRWVILRPNKTSVPGDLDEDGDVDSADLALLLGSWGACPPGTCAADLDGDGNVDAADLALQLGNWG